MNPDPPILLLHKEILAVRSVSPTELEDLAGAFQDAISPQRLGNVVRKPEFKDRVRCFLGCLTTPDVTLRQQRAAFFGQQGLSPLEADQLIDRIGLPRLRTYPDSSLLQIVNHYRAWSPIIRYLRDPDLRQHCGPAVEQHLLRLQQRIANYVRGQWQGAAPIEPEDATQEAICSAISKYTYEGPLDSWLRTVALNFVISADRLQDNVGIVEEEVAEPRKSSSQLDEDVSEVKKRWSDYYRVVRTTFDSEAVRLRLDMIWDQIVREGLGEEHVSDAELSRRIGEVHGPITPGNVGLSRFNLRKRLSILRYILEIASAKELDDTAVLAWMKKTNRVTPRETELVVQLAGWARSYRQTGRWPAEALH